MSTEDIFIEDVFKNDLRFQIWCLFSMYPELSLSDLSEKLGKCKSTIYPHLHNLIAHNIIEECREEKIRGNIKAKIYKLKLSYNNKLEECRENCNCEKFDGLSKEIAFKILEESIIRTKIHLKTLETELEFYEKLLHSGVNGPDEHAIKLMKEMYEINTNMDFLDYNRIESFESFGFLTLSEFNQFKTEYQNFVTMFFKQRGEEIQNFKNNKKSYYYFTSVIPIEKIYSYLNPTTKNR